MITLHDEHLKAVIRQTGYECLEPLLFLYWLVRNIKPDCVLELGTGYGCSTIFMGLANETVEIVSIDDYRGDTASSPEEPRKNLAACGISNRVCLINADTKNPLSNLWTDKIFPEIVFMDASHNEEDMQYEYAAFKDILASDHIIVIDDICSPGVINFVLKLAGKYELCNLLSFQNTMRELSGMAILATNFCVYIQQINDAKRRAINGQMHLR